MSLSRLALRLAAYEALNPYAALQSQVWPTLAGKNVYDSRITPNAGQDSWGDFLASIDGKPVVIVYTEESEVDPTSGEYPADREMADLVIEMMIAATAQVEVADAAGNPQVFGELVAALTSRQHEALLDLLEAQVRNLLDPQGYAASSAIFKKAARELHHVHSVPQRDAEKISRFAARTLRLKIRVPLTVWPALLTSPPPSGLALLPAPLGVVAGLLDPHSTGGALCAQMAALIAPASAPTPLTDIRMFLNVDRGFAPTATDDDITADFPIS